MFCLSVGEKSWGRVLEVVGKYAPHVPLFEIRLDYLEEELSLRAISAFFNEIRSLYPFPNQGKSEGRYPFIFTCRLPEEGGKRKVPEEERVSLLRWCLDGGALLVDFEWQALRRLLKREGRLPFPLERTLVSFHDFLETPRDRVLKGLLKSMSQIGVTMAKIVCYSDNSEDGLRTLSLIPYGKSLGMKVVAFGMGERLSWTRIVSLILGSPFTYVSQSEERVTAPGQLNLRLAKELYERLTGCIGFTG